MEKSDLRKKYQKLFKPSPTKVEVVQVPCFQFAMIDGEIEEGKSPAESIVFQQAIEALYGISYTLKFMSKLHTQSPIDYKVMALEALWWVQNGKFDITKPDNWHWTAMMIQPNHISSDLFEDAVLQIKAKKPNPALNKIHLRTFEEGLCIQIMHIGPYADEPKTIVKLAQFAEMNGYLLRGKHHEIYLSDPRRAKPENLKTVLRQPVSLKD